MMDCSEFRKSILADPRNPSAALRGHVASCHDCTAYTERLLRFEGRLERALRVTMESAPDLRRTGGAVILPFQSARAKARPPVKVRRRAVAVAASLLVGILVAGALWVAAPGSSLAADVVTHMAEEPDAWARTDVAVAAPKLNEVLDAAHLRLKPGAGIVTYANSCGFRGHVVPHLVVQTAAGPVTVMVLTQESVRRSTRFDEHGYHGMIVPVPHHGSLAVLERGSTADMESVEKVAAQVLGAIEWMPAAT